MRICMVGTGVAGAVYGQLFAEAGHDVSHYVRPGDGDDLGSGLRDGLPISLADGRGATAVERLVTYRPNVVTQLDPNRPFHLVVVSAPHYQLPELVPTLATRCGEAEFLFLGNLWSSYVPLDAFMAGRYRWGFPMVGGSLVDGRLEASLLDEVELGDPLGGHGARLHLATRLFEQCGLTVTTQPGMLDWLWVHFAIEASFVATASKAGGIESVLSDVDQLTETVLVVREALEVVKARGVDTRLRPEAQMFSAPERSVATSLFDLYAEDAAARKAVVLYAGRVDLHRIYRDVLATGQVLGVEMPLLSALEPYVAGLLVTAP